MQTIQLSEVNVRNLFNQKITDRVKTFDDILLISGKTMADIVKPGDTPDEVAYKQAKLIAEVYNEGTTLDPMDTYQRKCYPWHKINEKSGFGLLCGDCVSWTPGSGFGFRFCFKSAALAIDAGKKFIEIYETLKIK